MNDHRVWRGTDAVAPFDQPKDEVTILTPGNFEALVKAADLLQYFSTDEATGCNEVGIREQACVLLVVCRVFNRRDDNPARQRDITRAKRFNTPSEPAAMRDTVVVRECDDLTARRSPTRVAR
jgi:hypothetical protein